MWVFEHEHHLGLVLFNIDQKTSRIIWKIYFPECSGDPSANEWKWLWNVHMQICWIHHQRPTNHIHTGEYNLHRVLNMLLVTCVWTFNWHFILSFFKQKNMPYFRRRMVWEILKQKLLWLDTICVCVYRTLFWRVVWIWGLLCTSGTPRQIWGALNHCSFLCCLNETREILMHLKDTV